MTTSSQTLPDGKTLSEAYRRVKDLSLGVSVVSLDVDFSCFIAAHFFFFQQKTLTRLEVHPRFFGKMA